jgi:hypothetical protein
MSHAVGKIDSCPPFPVSQKMGRWINSCKPDEKFGLLEVLTAISTFAGTILLILVMFPLLVAGRTALTETLKSFGILSLSFGTCLLALGTISRKHIVHHYEGGLVREVSGKFVEFPWQEIQHVSVRKSWFRNNFTTVRIFSPKSRKIRFDSSYLGNSDTIIQKLKAQSIGSRHDS